jgi:PKD repeat protein
VASASCTGGNTIQFSGGGSSHETDYSWDFDDGSGSSAANPEHTYDADGSYTAILTVSGPGGQDTDSVSVSVPCS